MGSAYLPACYSPAPVLMFSSPLEQADQQEKAAAAAAGTAFAGTDNRPFFQIAPGLDDQGHLLGSGALMGEQGVNTERIVLKKSVLSGHPVKTKKRNAVVRYMFYNPDDVRWFKPVELWTKFGMTGHIREPVGTHGLMKCLFNRPVKNHDTVCLSLFKRIFPKPL